jgi:hypothetical protein
MYKYIYVYVYMYTHEYICMYIYICILICIGMYIYTYIYMYTYTHVLEGHSSKRDSVNDAVKIVGLLRARLYQIELSGELFHTYIRVTRNIMFKHISIYV